MMRHALLISSVLICACPQVDAQRVTVTSNITYGQGETSGGDLALVGDIHAPDKPQTLMPAIVSFHGGGWTTAGGDRTNAVCQTYANGLARKGFLVFNCDYRLDGDDPTVPAADETRFQTAYSFLTGNTAAAGAASCIDMWTAVRYLKANAESLCIDENKIFLSGHSAGAITALTAFYAPLDHFDSSHASNNLSESNTAAGAISISGSAEVALDESWITSADGRVMIWHGDADSNQYTDYDTFITPGLTTELDAESAPYDTYIKEGGGHFDFTTINGLEDWETTALWHNTYNTNPLFNSPMHVYMQKTSAGQ